MIGSRIAMGRGGSRGGGAGGGGRTFVRRSFRNDLGEWECEIHIETTLEVRTRVAGLTGVAVATRTPALWERKVSGVYMECIYLEFSYRMFV